LIGKVDPAVAEPKAFWAALPIMGTVMRSLRSGATDHKYGPIVIDVTTR